MAAMVPHWRNERCKSDVKRKRGALRRGALDAAQRGAGRCAGGAVRALRCAGGLFNKPARCRTYLEKFSTNPPVTSFSGPFLGRKVLQPAGLRKPAPGNRCNLRVCTDPRLKSVATCGFAEKAARKALRVAVLQILTPFRVACRFRRCRRVVMKGPKRIKTAFWSPCVVTGGLKRMRQTRKPPDLLRRSAKNRSNLVTDRSKRIGSAEKCGFCMFGRSVWGPA